jgi:hypothetical protein
VFPHSLLSVIQRLAGFSWCSVERLVIAGFGPCSPGATFAGPAFSGSPLRGKMPFWRRNASAGATKHDCEIVFGGS